MRLQSVNPSTYYEGKCLELFHPELNDPFCQLDVDHDERHQGFGMRWEREPQVDVETAQRFIRAYRAIPNGYKDIELMDDGTVTMPLKVLAQATGFIGVHFSE